MDGFIVAEAAVLDSAAVLVEKILKSTQFLSTNELPSTGEV